MSIFGLFTPSEIAEALREIGWTVIPPGEDGPRLIGVRATAQILNVHENTVRNWHATGELRGHPLRTDGTFLRFDVEDVEALRAQREAHRQ